MTHPCLFFFIKVLVSGILIASISSLAKVFPKWAALLTALPLMTILSMIWIYAETKNSKLLGQYTYNVLLALLPTLIFFVVAIVLFKMEVHFIWILLLSSGALLVGVYLFEKLGWLK